jgi:hypothetical protein
MDVFQIVIGMGRTGGPLLTQVRNPLNFLKKLLFLWIDPHPASPFILLYLYFCFYSNVISFGSKKQETFFRGGAI